MQTAQSNVRRPTTAYTEQELWVPQSKLHMLAPKVPSTGAIAPIAQTVSICYPTYPCQCTQLFYHYCLQLPSLELQRLLYQWVLNCMSLNTEGNLP